MVGAGAIAEHHLPWFATTRVAVLDSVVDTSTALATYAAERHGAPCATTDLDAALARRPDVVHVLTPPASHGALVVAALDAGAHVVCEKPLAVDAGAAAELLDHAERAGRLLVENHNYRFNRPVQRLAAAVAAGTLGPVHEVEVRIALDVVDPAGRFGDPNLTSPVHQLPAGVVHDFLAHLTYLPLLLVPDAEIDDVWCRLSNHRGGPAFRFDDLDAVVLAAAPDGPVHLRLRFDAMTRPELLSVEARGEAGTMAVELFQGRLERRLGREWAGPLAPVVDQAAGALALGRDTAANLVGKLRGRTAYEGIGLLLDRFYRAVATGGPAPVSADDILAAGRLGDRLIAAGSP